MGRVLLLVLLLANGGYWAYQQGGLTAVGLAPRVAATEPQRIAQQLQAEQLEVRAPDGRVRPVVPMRADAAAPSNAPVPTGTAPSQAVSAVVATTPATAAAPVEAAPQPNLAPAVASPAPEPPNVPKPAAAADSAAVVVAQATPPAPLSPPAPACQRIGLFDERAAASLRERLARASAATWRLDTGVQSARWIVYMGRYPEPELLARKQSELRARKVPFEPVRNAALEPGLSLGGFDTLGEAVSHLDTLTERGVRTARVVQERPERRGTWLVAPQGPLPPPFGDAIRSVLGERVWEPCAKG